MSTQGSESAWVRWWCKPWYWAHPQWHAQFAAHQGLSLPLCEALAARHPQAFLHSLGLVASQPPPPAEPVLQWLALSPAQREQALGLAACICFSATAQGTEQGQWCLALHKALRPSAWLGDTTDARALLAAWVGPLYWPRLRLAWPPGAALPVPCSAPEKKLHALWHAVLWRVAQY